MGRYVRRGSKGIALVDDSGDRPRLRYVFDISDTGTREHSRTPWLWQLEERHLDSCRSCWSAPMMFPVMTLPDSSLR